VYGSITDRAILTPLGQAYTANQAAVTSQTHPACEAGRGTNWRHALQTDTESDIH